MISEIFLHIGYPKTASTTIQKFFLKHRNEFNGFDIFSIHPDGRKNKSGNSQRMLPYKKGKGFQLVEFDHWKLVELSKFLLKKSESLGTERVLISAERFILADRESIELFREFLSGYSQNIRVIVYLRRQDKSARSFFQESCKPKRKMTNLWGITKDIFPASSSTHALAYFDYCSVLESWEKVFGINNIMPRVFEETELIENNVIVDFMGSLNIPISNNMRKKIDRFKSINISLSRMQQQVLIYSYKNKLPLRVRQKIYSQISLFQCQDKLLPSKEEAESFYKKFKSGNQKLAKKYNLSVDSLFDESFSEYPANSNLELSDGELKKIESFVSAQCDLFGFDLKARKSWLWSIRANLSH